MHYTMHIMQVLHLRPEDLRASQPARPHHQKESPGQAVSGRGQSLAMTLYLSGPMTRTVFCSLVEPDQRAEEPKINLPPKMALLKGVFSRDLVFYPHFSFYKMLFTNRLELSNQIKKSRLLEKFL
jgi:hypothetical protein